MLPNIYLTAVVAVLCANSVLSGTYVHSYTISRPLLTRLLTDWDEELLLLLHTRDAMHSVPGTQARTTHTYVSHVTQSQ